MYIFAFAIKRIECEPPFTTDPNIWNSYIPEELEGCWDCYTKDEVALMMSNVSFGLFKKIPKKWLDAFGKKSGYKIAAYASNDISAGRRDDAIEILDCYGDLLKLKEFKIIGYDVTDNLLTTSLIYTPNFSSSTNSFVLDAIDLNKFGLFKTRESAISYIESKKNDPIMQAHQTFSEVAVCLPPQSIV